MFRAFCSSRITKHLSSNVKVNACIFGRAYGRSAGADYALSNRANVITLFFIPLTISVSHVNAMLMMLRCLLIVMT